MSKKVTMPVILVVLFSILLSACGGAATPAAPVVEPTVAATAVPTEAPVVTEAPALDVTALWSALVADLPADKGYGTVAATKLNEELVEKPVFMLDVREAAELEKDGFIEGAVNIPVRDVLNNLDKLPAQDQPIVIYCASGHRGGFVTAALKSLGYSNVRNLAGGIGAWKKAELPVVTGSMPAAPEVGAAPEMKDQALYTLLNDYLTNLPEGFYTTKADVLNADLADGKQLFLLDVRRADEFEKNGRIAGATNVPFEELFASLDKLPADKTTAMVIYCVSGHRGSIALMGLRLLGYENVVNLGGGINAWKAAGFPLEGYVDWNATWGEFLAALPSDMYAIGAADLNAAMADKAPFLLDVREAAEVKEGFIAGAVNIPVRELLDNLDKLPAQDQPIVIYCASGHRGGLAMSALRLLGYSDVKNLGGGIGAWKKAEFALVTDAEPAAPVAGTAPAVDAARFDQLKAFLSGLPEGFFTMKAADVNAALGEAAKPFVLDVRTAEELTKDGYIEGSVNIPIVELWTRLSELPADKAAPIIVLCKSGHRGAIAMMALRMNGYTNVSNLGGGINAWIAAELPVVK